MHFDKWPQFQLMGPLNLSGEADGCSPSHCERKAPPLQKHLCCILLDMYMKTFTVFQL